MSLRPVEVARRPRKLSWDHVDSLREEGFDELADIAERYLTKRTWRNLWRIPKRPATPPDSPFPIPLVESSEKGLGADRETRSAD